MLLIRYNIKVAIIILNERQSERERERAKLDKQACCDVRKEGEGSNQEDPSFTNE